MVGIVGFVVGQIYFSASAIKRRAPPAAPVDGQPSPSLVPTISINDDGRPVATQSWPQPHKQLDAAVVVEPQLEIFGAQIEADVTIAKCSPARQSDVTCWAHVALRTNDETITIDTLVVTKCWRTTGQNEREELPELVTLQSMQCLRSIVSALPRYPRNLTTPNELDVVLQFLPSMDAALKK
jgi:hypothetical protein